MAQGLNSENDIQRAIDRLVAVLPERLCRLFFTRERLLRLERMVNQRIAHTFFVDLIVRQEGPSLRPRLRVFIRPHLKLAIGRIQTFQSAALQPCD